MFTGTFHRSLDSKLRVLLPKRLRQDLAGDSEMYLTPGTDHCLELHTVGSLNEMAQRVRESTTDSRNLRTFARLFYARARLCEIDNQGRIRIPVELGELAQFEKEIVFVGVGCHWEIWDQHRWQEYLQGHGGHYDLIASNTFDHPTAAYLTPAPLPLSETDPVQPIAIQKRVAR